MTRRIELGEGESLIELADELLFRQVPEHLYDEIAGRPASHAFGPAHIDQGKPSYTRSSRTTARASRQWHNENARTASLAVFGVSVDEVTRSGTYAVDDSEAPLTPGAKRAPGHCFVSFREHEKREIRRIRAILLRYALERGELESLEVAA